MKTKIFKTLLCAAMLFMGGCFSQRTAPHLGFGNFDIRTEMSREDIEVLGRVEGISTTESIILGLIQIVDSDKLRLLGFPFFTEKFASSWNEVFWMNSTEHRAYYKALEAAPEADAVFYKSIDYEVSGLPLIWWTETATCRGKAIKLKSDQERYATDKPAKEIKGYQAERDLRTGEIKTFPVYEDEQNK